MTSSVVHLFSASSRARNQALAYIYRAQDILAGSGIPVEITTGTTDEGDHWIVACDPDTQHVLAHVAIINGEVIADSAAFVRPFRTRDIQAALDRVLRALKVDARELASGTNGLVAVLVAAAVLHLSHADAALLPPLDLDEHGLPVTLIEHTPTIAILRAVLAAADIVDETVEHFRAALHADDAPPVPDHDGSPLLDFHDNVDMSAVDHRYQPLHEGSVEAEHAVMPTAEPVSVSIPAPAIPAPAPAAQAPAHTPVEHHNVAQKLTDTAALTEAPPTVQDVTAAVQTFVDAAQSTTVADNHGSMVVYGQGVDWSQTFTMSDGSTVKLIGVEDMAHLPDMSVGG